MIRVGVTGHRPHRLKVSEAALGRRVKSVLSALAGARRAGLEVVSPLAEGTDQIVAGVALDLGLAVAALLPFKRRAYEATFSDPERITVFRELLAAAGRRLVLDGNPARSQAAYVAIGNVTLAQADIVLTIWDGKPAQGRGGTPEILQNALEWGIPIVWIDATADRAPRLLSSKKKGATPPNLMWVARRAPPLNRRALRKLATGVQAN